jgi:CRISPR-associated protein Csm1
MFQLGDDLFDVRSMVRSHRKDIEAPVHTVEFQIGQQSSETVYYHLFKGSRPIIQDPQKLDQSVIAYLINNWDLNDYQFRYFQENVVPMLLGNYGQQVIDQNTRQPRFMRAEEMAAGSQGIDRVGYLRMDVDRLGQIFARGLQSSFSLPRLAGLSRQMSYFFKVYLNSLAEQRSKNLPANAQTLKSSPDSIPGDRPNLLFIYAGGDDLFVSGAWNEVVEFAFDVYQAFRAYTGNNPAITLSGGISIETEKFPLYQAAEAAGSAEKAAKGGGRDRLGLFAEVLQWSEWLGATQPTMIQELMKGIYENVARAVIDRPPGNEQQWEDQIQEIAQQCFEPDDPKTYPVWLGVLPLVQRLYQHQDQYSSSFIRNLLLTAQLQKQRLDEKQKQIDALKKKNQLSGDDPALLNARIDKEQLRYYLHLPQIAYTLRLLGESSGKEENEQDGTKESPLEPVRKSLKSPYNAPYFRAIATWIELLTRTSEP